MKLFDVQNGTCRIDKVIFRAETTVNEALSSGLRIHAHQSLPDHTTIITSEYYELSGQFYYVVLAFEHNRLKYTAITLNTPDELSLNDKLKLYRRFLYQQLGEPHEQDENSLYYEFSWATILAAPVSQTEIGMNVIWLWQCSAEDAASHAPAPTTGQISFLDPTTGTVHAGNMILEWGLLPEIFGHSGLIAADKIAYQAEMQAEWLCLESKVITIDGHKTTLVPAFCHGRLQELFFALNRESAEHDNADLNLDKSYLHDKHQTFLARFLGRPSQKTAMDTIWSYPWGRAIASADPRRATHAHIRIVWYSPTERQSLVSQQAKKAPQTKPATKTRKEKRASQARKKRIQKRSGNSRKHNK